MLQAACHAHPLPERGAARPVVGKGAPPGPRPGKPPSMVGRYSPRIATIMQTTSPCRCLRHVQPVRWLPLSEPGQRRQPGGLQSPASTSAGWRWRILTCCPTTSARVCRVSPSCVRVLLHHDYGRLRAGLSARRAAHGGRHAVAGRRCREAALCESGHSQCGFVAGRFRRAAGQHQSFHNACVGPTVDRGRAGAAARQFPGAPQRVMAALDADAGVIDVAWAQRMMAAHGTAQDAVCRHPLAGRRRRLAGLDGSTISSVIFQPARSTRNMKGQGSGSP